MLDRPIFVVSQHRSGSTLLRNILDRHSEVAMASDEMHLAAPFRNTFLKQFGRLNNAPGGVSVDAVLHLIFDEDIYGTFWRDFREQYLDARDGLRKKLIQKNELTEKSVITAILNEVCEQVGKARVGVKYPLHISRAEKLLEWFPDAKILYLARDPRGIIYSKLNDEATRRRKKKSRVLGWGVHVFTLLYFLVEYNRISAEFSKHSEDARWCLIRYEDLTSDPERRVKEVCDFCGLGFENEMLDVTGKPSSHTDSAYSGIAANSAFKWQRMNRWQQILIRLFSAYGRRIDGYEADAEANDA